MNGSSTTITQAESAADGATVGHGDGDGDSDGDGDGDAAKLDVAAANVTDVADPPLPNVVALLDAATLDPAAMVTRAMLRIALIAWRSPRTRCATGEPFLADLDPAGR